MPPKKTFATISALTGAAEAKDCFSLKVWGATGSDNYYQFSKDCLKMRIASISIVKNEADIIEAFVRHNLAFIDRMFFIDDRSTDNTSEILRRLSVEHPSVTLIDDGWNGAYHQSKRTTAALKLVRKMEDWDCVLALDADEFICTDARSTFETEIRAIPPASPGGFRAVHYCIHPTDDSSIVTGMSTHVGSR